MTKNLTRPRLYLQGDLGTATTVVSLFGIVSFNGRLLNGLFFRTRGTALRVILGKMGSGNVSH
ncbi:MAG: hypothetical protein KA715_05795 [Xanthomonadaceae bacterium]|nr:hypothetical protein [Xanthomonadaceae bacterium]